MRAISAELEVREGATDSNYKRKDASPRLDVVPLEEGIAGRGKTQAIVVSNRHHKSRNEASQLDSHKEE